MTTNRALCATLLPTVGDIWFSTTPADRAEAKQVCTRCPMFFGCATAGIATPGTRGVWGGLDAGDRAGYLGKPDEPNPDDEAENRRRLSRRPCGSEAAFVAHRTFDEDCGRCERAHAVRLEATRRERLAEEHAKGGTGIGGAIHRRLGEPACVLCRAGAARDQAARKARGRAEGARAWAGGAGASRAASGPQPEAQAAA